MTRVLTATIFSLTLLTSCFNGIEGTGDAISEKRAMMDFDELVLDCSADVNIHQNLIKVNNNVEVVVRFFS